MPTETMNTEAIIKMFDQYVVPNYRRYPVSLERGQGSQVWDAEGKRYLDLFPGWGCNLLGHCPPRVVKAVQDQVATLIHVPNTWHMEAQGTWAKLLSERSFGGQAFFCNSGTEANEAAIKLARLHHGPDRYKIITFHHSFHGRTFAATAATGQPKYHEGIGPMLAGFAYAPFADLAAVQQLIDEKTCAIMIEPVQGEGGVNIPPDGFLAGLRTLCDEHDLLLMFDEVQTGCGRTGEWFAYQHFDVTPDVMTLAKAVCGGIAGGVMLTTAEIAPSLRPGMHAATFGGNPIAAVAGIATIETIEQDGLLAQADSLAQLFRSRFEALANELDWIREVRVLGMMIGLELLIDGSEIVQRCMQRGLLINCTQQTVIRLLPALNLTQPEAEEGIEILSDVLRQVTV